MPVPSMICDICCTMFRRKKSVNKKRLEHKLYLARETPEPVFDLSDCDLINVPAGIFSLCKVFLKECLMLQNNQLCSLSGGGDLKDLSNLKILNLSNNSFNTIPEDIHLLKCLQELYIDSNELKGLPNSICSLEDLKILSVSNNKLKTLPENMGCLTSLHTLKLLNNPNLKCLPKSICKAQRLILIEVDSENFLYPPSEIVESGSECIMKFICSDVDFEYIPPSELLHDKKENERTEIVDEPDRFEEFIWNHERLKMKKMQEFLETERNNELLQEAELASVHRANREKLLASITEQQSQLDSKLCKIQQQKEYERFRLIEQLQDAENNADIAINNLLALNKEPAAQLLEREKEEEEKLLAAVNRYNENLCKDEILSAMQDILRQETEMFIKFDRDRIETSRSILEQELDTDSRLSHILQDQDIHKANLVAQLMEDSNLQKAAVGTLLERGDARSWGLLQQVRLVEAQLFALTTIEIDRKKLKMDEHLNDLGEKRINLSILLIDLLDQQRERRAQLLRTLQSMEEYNREQNEDFWLRQYQRLLEKFPEGLSQAQKNIDPKLAKLLLTNGVLHCLPFLAKLTQSNYNTKSITEQHLLEAGITTPSDRLKILDALQIYSKEYLSFEFTPSAPFLESEGASAPILDDVTAISSVECVICMEVECHIIFVPCGHLCCCSQCSVKVTECPLCRADIERKITMMQLTS